MGLHINKEEMRLFLSLFAIFVNAKPSTFSIKFKEKEPLNRIGIDHPYVCSNFDWWPDAKCDYGNCSWVGNGINNLDFENPVLKQAARALSGNLNKFGILRIGGSLEDQINYNFTAETEHCDPYPMEKNTTRHSGFNDGCLTKMKRSQLQKFAKETNLKIIFGLNGLIGRTQTGRTDWSGQWDPKQAKKLFDEMIETGFIDQIWGIELGNEIYGSHGSQAKNISPQVAATDFANLFEIMHEKFSSKNRPYLFGTDNALDLKWASEFIDELREKNATLDGFNWHAYPLGAGAYPQVDKNIMDYTFGAKVDKTAESLNSEKWAGSLGKGIWMGETGGAYNSGRNTVTNRFMSAFWYLDWLGILANRGHKGFCRQTLIGGNYGLLQNENGTIVPNPDFWAAYMFNEFMIGDVLEIENAINSKVHIFATNSVELTILLLNYDDDDVEIDTKSSDIKKYSKRSIYAVTSDDLQSKNVFINQKKAEFPKNPDWIPALQNYEKREVNTWPLKLSKHSYTFLRLFEMDHSENETNL